ncbi:MAG: endonuclease/exonuclease/phosphatase family protein [Candidatus Sumerlaeaceae bacterium]|nr:endonuclease/exonuclease/phosphatase family protein [Candidatus Sumerlaeaceae bacterium]
MKRLFPFVFVIIAAVAGHATSTLSLVTYNIHSGIPNGLSSAKHAVTQQDLQNIADVLKSASPDIVALQEVRCEWTSKTVDGRSVVVGPNEPRDFARLTGLGFAFGSAIDDAPKFPANTGYKEWANAGDPVTTSGAIHGEYGNAVLSRLPFRTPPENIALPNREGKEQRACLRLEMPETHAGPLVVYATHLQHDSAEIRVDQMTEILRRASSEATGTLVLLMGDFNYHPGTAGDLLGLAARAGFHDLQGEAAKTAGVEPEPTFPADKPKQRIDYIMANRPLKVIQAKVIESEASDHRALWIQVALEKP